MTQKIKNNIRNIIVAIKVECDNYRITMFILKI